MALGYSELLRDPRWQRKRLEILQRDNFSCRFCNSDRNTLHVHHQYYRQGAKPWEYEDSCFLTLCMFCHKEETDGLKSAWDNLRRGLAIHGIASWELNLLAAAIESIPPHDDPRQLVRAIADALNSPATLRVGVTRLGEALYSSFSAVCRQWFGGIGSPWESD